MRHVSEANSAPSHWWYYRIVFGIVLLSLAYSFWRIFQHQAKLNHQLAISIQDLNEEKLQYDQESSELIDRIADRVEMGMPIHRVVTARKSDPRLNEKLIPLLLTNLKDRRSAVVDHALKDLASLLSREENPGRWKADLQSALLPMIKDGTRDRELVEVLLLVGVDTELIRSRLLDQVYYDDINTVLHAGKVMQWSYPDLDPLTLYVDYLRQRDYGSMEIIREIELDNLSRYGTSMKDRFFSALQREMLEAETPQQQARLQVWIDYVKDPTTLPDKYRPLENTDQGPF